MDLSARLRQWSSDLGPVLMGRLRMGTQRIQINFGQIVQLTVAAMAAYSFCYFVLGHAYPFFAAVAAVVGIGPMQDRRLRRSLEIGCGAVLGVLVGDVFVHLFGSGVWQLGVILFFAVCMGMFLNSGAIFVTQLGIQSIFVVTVPAELATGTFSRTGDAAVGVATAILMALVIPSDARKRPRNQAAALLAELARLLRETEDALRREDPQAARRALSRARDSQGYVDSWRASLRISEETARINANSRRYAAEVSRLGRACEFADRALRLIRVILRRAVTATERGRVDPILAEASGQLAEGARRLRLALLEGGDRSEAEEVFTAAARTLRPAPGLRADLEQTTMLLLFRPLAVDLLQAAGCSLEEANAHLPALEVEPETGALRVVEEPEAEGPGAEGPGGEVR
ncbi:FUSC family protein [Brevibacterium album]|uniref:FUSC family protein n=1 Tax=Brevibacterium album TaxID=417948 RepID=UPI0003F89D05|nr:FUSC family protein [Brevibacterium album]